jgi:hypothetical protein
VEGTNQAGLGSSPIHKCPPDTLQVFKFCVGCFTFWLFWSNNQRFNISVMMIH